MLGKLLGAWIGKKEGGAKGAILGYGAASLMKRGVPTIAALALGGLAFKKWRERRRQAPSYPAEDAPRAPASETSSPS